MITIIRDEAVIHVTTRTNLENIVLSERSQTQKATSRITHFHEMSRIGKSLETGSRLVIAKGEGERKVRSDCLMVSGLTLE